MRACTLGCDHLFEMGYVLVDADGTIQQGPVTPTTADLDGAVNRIVGRGCTAHSRDSELYLEWHRASL